MAIEREGVAEPPLGILGDLPTATGTRERKPYDYRERLQTRFLEGSIARTEDGELVVQTWDDLLRFVYPDEFSEENRQRLTRKIRSARRSILRKLPDILITDELSDETTRINAVFERYPFYKGTSVKEKIAFARRRFLPAKVAIEPDDDADPDQNPNAATDSPEEPTLAPAADPTTDPTPNSAADPEPEPTGEPIDRRMLTVEAAFGLTEIGDFITAPPESMAQKVFEDEVTGLSSAEIEAIMPSILGRFHEYLRDLKYLLRAARADHMLTALQRRQFDELREYVAKQPFYPKDITPMEMFAIADRAKTAQELIADRLRNG